jgi:hypothetical protein
VQFVAMFPFVYFDDETVRLWDDDRPISEVDDSELLELMRRFAASRERKCFHRKSLSIWLAVLRAIDDQRPPMTVRGLFYALEILGLFQKRKQAIGK